jgi:hypothetical protein
MATFLPIGMSMEDARAIARATEPADVLAYADAVLNEARAFLATCSPGRFDEVPPNREHLSDARYRDSAGYMRDVNDMFEQGYWRVFAGACTGHCRGHIGELELGLAIIRGR